jgi:hypothetical protein
MKKHLLMAAVLSAIVFSFFTFPVALAAPGATQNVIIVIIDGIRYDEVTEEYMPYTLGSLKPQGTFYTNFYNTALTSTTPGHQTIITGVRQLLKNNRHLKTRQRTKEPNIFEYCRKELGIPMEKTWIVAGKQGNLEYLDYSLHPDYGYAYRSSIYRENDEHLFSPEDVEGYHPTDEQIRDVAFDRMATHPSLMLINLKDVDAMGHTGDFEKYTQAIITADRIVYDLWQKIQSDIDYAGKTTLIITTDHGRHSDGVGSGFKGHGGYSRGDRHLIFLALGPDIKEDTVIDTRRDQIDIVPTIGALLGFQTPYAEGLVMEKMFSNPLLNNPDLGNKIITGGARKPKMAVNQDGIHLVWSEKRGQEWDIYYKRSNDGGLTWIGPIVLFQSDDKNFFYEADITAGPLWVHVTATGYSSTDSGGDTYAWKLYCKWGYTYGTQTYLDFSNDVLMDLKTMLGSPSICSYDTKTNIAITEKGQKFWSFDGFYTNWTEARIDSSTSMTKNIVSYATATNGQDTYAVWPAIFSTKRQEPTAKQKKWNLYLDKYDPGTASWGSDDRITSNTGQRYFFYDPAVDLNDNGLLRAVWARFVDKEDGTGIWKIFYQGTSDGGETWSPQDPKRLSNNSLHSWSPDITFLERSKAQAYAVWEAHDQGVSEIQGILRQGGIWNDIVDLTEPDGLDSVEPDIASYGGKVYLTWQDMKNGNWGIEFREVSIDN